MNFIFPVKERNHQEDIVKYEHVRSMMVILSEGSVADLLRLLRFVWRYLKAAVCWAGGGMIPIVILVRGAAEGHVSRAPFDRS